MSIGDRFDSDQDETITPDDRRADRRIAESRHRQLRSSTELAGAKRPKMRHERTGGRVRDWDEEDDDDE